VEASEPGRASGKAHPNGTVVWSWCDRCDPPPVLDVDAQELDLGVARRDEVGDAPVGTA